MILLPSTRQRIARHPLLFRAHDCVDETGLFALSYGQKVYLQHTRASLTSVYDQRGRRVRIPSGMPALGYFGGRAALRMDPASSQLFLSTGDFSAADWSKTNVTVGPNNTTGPSGDLTADRLTATAAAATLAFQAATVNATVATFSIRVKRGSGDTDANRFVLYNQTTALNLVTRTFNYATGVLTGSDGFASAVALGDGWWELTLSAVAGITSGNVLRGYACFDGQAEAAGEYAYVDEAQLEPLAHATSYMPRVSAAVSRAADLGYFAFLMPPTAPLTAFVRQVHRGAFQNDGLSKRFLHVGAQAVGTDPRFVLLGLNSSAASAVLYDDGATLSTQGAAVTAAIGDRVDSRGVITAPSATAWAVDGSARVNGGAETTGAPSGISTPGPGYWAQPRCYLAGGLDFDNVPVDYHAALLGTGNLSMAECADLCEVG